MTGQRTEDPRAQAEEYLTELAARIEINGNTGEPSSGRIFDAGRPGLDFFRRFGPSYAALRGRPFDFDSEILAPYDDQREIAFGKFRADAERVGQLSSTMTETDLDYRNSADSIFAYWHGTAADNAKDRMDGFLSSAGSAWAQLNGFAETLLAACDCAERIVFDKAKAVFELAADTVGGLTVTNVAKLVACAAVRDAEDLTDGQLTDLAELCSVDIVPAVCRANPDVLNLVLRSARTWLDGAFAPFYEARLAVFDAACAHAEADLDLVWGSLKTALGELTADRFATVTATPQQAVHAGGISATLNPGPTVEPQSAADNSLPDGAKSAADPNDQSMTLSGMSSELPAFAPSIATPPPQTVATNYYGGTPYYGSYGQLGGGDTEHKRKVPLKGTPIVDDDHTVPTGARIIGGDDDPNVYQENNDPQQNIPPPPAAQRPAEQEPKQPAEPTEEELIEDQKLLEKLLAGEDDD